MHLASRIPQPHKTHPTTRTTAGPTASSLQDLQLTTSIPELQLPFCQHIWKPEHILDNPGSCSSDLRVGQIPSCDACCCLEVQSWYLQVWLHVAAAILRQQPGPVGPLAGLSPVSRIPQPYRSLPASGALTSTDCFLPPGPPDQLTVTYHQEHRPTDCTRPPGSHNHTNLRDHCRINCNLSPGPPADHVHP